MRILLISTNLAEEPYAVFPLGLGIIVHTLRARGHVVRIFDFLFEKADSEKLGEEIKKFRPELIGLGIRNVDNVNYLAPAFFLDVAAKLVTKVKSCCDAPVFVGGAGFSLMPEAILDFVGADYGIAGAGENAVLELTGYIERNELPPYIIYGKTTDCDFGSCDYEEDITRFYLSKTGMLPLQTKRGCPGKCIYCSYPGLEGNHVISRDADEVLEDLMFIQKRFEPETIYFTDSVFNDSGKQYIELLEKIASKGMKFPWCAFFSPDEFSSENIDLMKRTGLKTVELGADAYTDRTLAGLGKHYDFDTVFRSCEIFRNAGIKVSSSYIAGGPGENHETLREGIENLKRIYWVPAFLFMGIRVFPGTRIERVAREEGLLTEASDLLNPVFYLSPEISERDLFEGLNDGVKDMPHVVFPPQSRNDELKLFMKFQIQQRKKGDRNIE
ncbi:MAG: hypothetical protein A2020_14995 [Lentisphaerae bacterium GWF2_45_14]|nr:MAG: hypothetical protein A2020_14995 [Lentisphaerae bacterium GWF2_45_14]